MRVKRLNHCVYQCQYHIVLPTKYRRKIFNDGIFAYFKERLRRVLRLYPQLEVSEQGDDRDHIHLLVGIPPSMSVSDCVRVLKSFLSWDIKKRFKFLQYVYYGTDGIWSDGYFVSTVGINAKQIRRYIEMQGKEDFGQTMELVE
ncbi:MAG: IS200/IS605 family transposase [Elusimicrobiaceae bacterium]